MLGNIRYVYRCYNMTKKLINAENLETVLPVALLGFDCPGLDVDCVAVLFDPDCPAPVGVGPCVHVRSA